MKSIEYVLLFTILYPEKFIILTQKCRTPL